jgi:hypothetical protein
MTRLTRIRTDRRRVAGWRGGAVRRHSRVPQGRCAGRRRKGPRIRDIHRILTGIEAVEGRMEHARLHPYGCAQGQRDSMRFRYRDHHPGAGLLPLQRRVRGRLHERRRACGDDHGARTGIGRLLPAPDRWSKSRVESRYARRRQRRPQCHLHRKPEHRESHCERVRSVSGNRQDRGHGAGTSIGKQSGANLLAGLHPEFPMACDGQN